MEGARFNRAAMSLVDPYQPAIKPFFSKILSSFSFSVTALNGLTI
jgi:hypothetical protein